MNSAVNTFDPPASEGGEAAHRESPQRCAVLCYAVLCSGGTLHAVSSSQPTTSPVQDDAAYPCNLS